VKFSLCPSILLDNRECPPLGVHEGVKIPPKGQILPLGARGEVKNGPLAATAEVRCPPQVLISFVSTYYGINVCTLTWTLESSTLFARSPYHPQFLFSSRQFHSMSRSWHHFLCLCLVSFC
jgi:hypothetical protein